MGVFSCSVCGDPAAYNSFNPSGMRHNCPGVRKLQWDDAAPTKEQCQRLLDEKADYLVTGENLRRPDCMLYRSVGHQVNVRSDHLLVLIATAWMAGAAAARGETPNVGAKAPT